MAPRIPGQITPRTTEPEPTPTTTAPAIRLPRIPKIGIPAVTVPQQGGAETPVTTPAPAGPRIPRIPGQAPAPAMQFPTPQGPPAPGTTRAEIPVAIPGEVAMGPVQGPPAPGTSRAELTEATRNFNRARLAAQRAGVPTSTIEEIVNEPEPNAAFRILGKVINFDIIRGKGEFKPIATTVIKPLVALDTGRRAVLSTIKELGDEFAVYREALFGTGRGRGVGVDPVTGRPYKHGAGGFSFADWWDQTTNTEDDIIGYGQLVGDVFPSTNIVGRTANRAIGLTGDIILDPVTWVSGPGGLIKSAAGSTIEAGAKTAAREAAEAAARQAADRAANIAADTAATAAQKAAAQAAAIDAAGAAARAAAEETAAIGAARTAASQTPRRVIGARSREEIAQITREVRDEAIAAGNTRVANVLTDEVIGNIATRGYSAIRGEVADVLGVRGGLRIINPFGSLKNDVQRVVIPGTERLTNAIGSTLTGIRIGPGRQIARGLNIPVVRNVVSTINKGFVGTPFGRRIVEGVTPTGEGGLWGSETVSAMRRGLRTGQVVDPTTGAIRKITGPEAEDFVKLLAQDRAYRLLQAEASASGIQLLMPVLSDPNFFRYSGEISELLETPSTSAILSDATIDVTEKANRVSAALNRPVDQQLVQYANDLRRIGDEYYERANFLHQRQQLAAGVPLDSIRPLPKNANWFPHVLTDRARLAIERNKINAAILEEATGFDRTFALAGSNPRTIVVGDKFFGYTIKPKDIEGGVRRLNEIARQYGGLKFDFFETNAEAAFTRYAQGFAKDTAFTNWLYNMAQASTGQGPFAAKGFGGDIVQSIVETVPAKPPSTVQGFTAAVQDVLSPERVQVLSQAPAAKAKLERLVTDMQTLLARFPKDMDKVPANFTLWRDDINSAINQLEIQIRELERVAQQQAGFAVPDIGFGPVLSSEAEALYTSLLNEANGLVVAVNNIKPDMWVNILPQWQAGFENLLRVNSLKYPGLQATPEIQELLTNVRRLEDPVVAQAANIAFNRVTGMFKAWVTATPGFHVRNSLSNTFFMLSAGADPANITEASRFFTSFRNFLKNRNLDEAITPDTLSQAIDQLQGVYAISPRLAEQQARELASGAFIPGVGQLDPVLLDYFRSTDFISGYLGIKGKSFDDLLKTGGAQYDEWLEASQRIANAYTGARTSGVGQIGEIFEQGARPGITGRQLTRTIGGAEGAAETARAVRETVSRGIAKPLTWSRRAGGFIEDWSRFALTYDGLVQGLSPEQAAARTAKYLIDYQDLSSVDRAIKQIIPFWMWSSRSFPLIVESMWMNPRAYAVYNNIARNIQSEEGEGFRPSYLQQAIGLRGNLLFNPDFGFQRQEEGLANLTDPGTILGGLTPVLRAPVEAVLNQRFGIGGQVYSPWFSEPGQAQLRYVAEQTFPQLGAAEKYATVAAAAATILSLGEAEARAVLGALPKSPEDTLTGKAAGGLQKIEIKLPGTDETIFKIGKPSYIEKTDGPLTREEALNKLFGFFGVPATFLLDYQQVQALKTITEQLQQAASRQKNK